MNTKGLEQTRAIHSSLSGCYNKSKALFGAAHSVFPGGVTRSSVDRDPHPIYIERGEGSRLLDIDGNWYLDFANNFTTLIHGHAFPPLVTALKEQIQKGTCYSNPTKHEFVLAQIICERVPSIDKIRFVNTGTEAVMTAVKAARTFTGKTKIAKFEGAYHGSYDWAEISEDSAPENWGDRNQPLSVRYYEGSPNSVLDETLILPLNAIDETLRLLEQSADDLACLLIDVMPSRSGLIKAEQPYLQMLRSFCNERNILIISDEVLNFRQSFSGASARFGLTPDLITLGKIIGGGLPIGAIGGREEVMAVFNNSRVRARVPQGGTFSANPLSMVAGTVSMEALNPDVFAHLERLGDYARKRLSDVISQNSLPLSFTGQGSLIRLHPKTEAPLSNREAYQNTTERLLLQRLQQHLIHNGVMLAAGGLIALSSIMGENEVDELIAAFACFEDLYPSN